MTRSLLYDKSRTTERHMIIDFIEINVNRKVVVFDVFARRSDGEDANVLFTADGRDEDRLVWSRTGEYAVLLSVKDINRKY